MNWLIEQICWKFVQKIWEEKLSARLARLTFPWLFDRKPHQEMTWKWQLWWVVLCNASSENIIFTHVDTYSCIKDIWLDPEGVAKGGSHWRCSRGGRIFRHSKQVSFLRNSMVKIINWSQYMIVFFHRCIFRSWHPLVLRDRLCEKQLWGFPDVPKVPRYTRFNSGLTKLRTCYSNKCLSGMPWSPRWGIVRGMFHLTVPTRQKSRALGVFLICLDTILICCNHAEMLRVLDKQHTTWNVAF